MLQLRQAGLRGGERDQLLLERSHRIGPAQQCAGAAAQGSELLHFAVIGQDQQDGHGQQAGMQTQNAGRLDARGHDPDPGHARVAQGASVQSGESLAFAEQKNAGQAAVSAGHGVFLAYTKGHGAASAAVAFTLYI